MSYIYGPSKKRSVPTIFSALKMVGTDLSCHLKADSSCSLNEEGATLQGGPFKISLLRGEQVQKRLAPLMRPIEGI